MGSIILEILIFFFKCVERKNKILRLGHYPCLGIWSALVLPASLSPLKAFQSFCPCGEDGDYFQEAATVVSAAHPQQDLAVTVSAPFFGAQIGVR